MASTGNDAGVSVLDGASNILINARYLFTTDMHLWVSANGADKRLGRVTYPTNVRDNKWQQSQMTIFAAFDALLRLNEGPRTHG